MMRFYILSLSGLALRRHLGLMRAKELSEVLRRPTGVQMVFHFFSWLSASLDSIAAWSPLVGDRIGL